MKNNDFISFPLPNITNPLIVRKDSIEAIYPHEENKLKSHLILKTKIDNSSLYIIDESTTSIANRI